VILDSLGIPEPPAATSRQAQAQPLKFPDIIGANTTLAGVLATIERVAKTKANVLILGESGTGKELAARALHRLSERRDRPFVAVNCAAIPETLLEAELFGIEKGTATGVSAREGKFETADSGTVFLDEIGDMSLATQAKILRVLQERQFERVGARQPRKVDVRVVAATNRNLEEAMSAGRFRQDLYYRLNVITVSMPPLRERREDIPALVAHFRRGVSEEYGKPVKGVSDGCLQSLLAYAWPGNVRELENVIERGVILCAGECVQVDDLPSGVRQAAGDARGFKEAREHAGKAAAGSVELAAVKDALESSGWVVKRAAERLGVSRRQLYRIIDKHNLRRPTADS
jgi:transcriptional regulator with PAS, ATPase and Fis domain